MMILRCPTSRTLLLSAALGLATALGASALEAQEPPRTPLTPQDCAFFCALSPDSVPAECTCGIATGGESGDGVVKDPAAAKVLQGMREEYLKQIAGIENYTVVQVNSVGGPPVVLYYEKETVGGLPVFRQVSPAELARREAEATGVPTPAQTAEGLATMFDMLGDMAGGAASGSSGGAEGGQQTGGDGGDPAGAGGAQGDSAEAGPGEGSAGMMALVGALIGEVAAASASGSPAEASAGGGANAASGTEGSPASGGGGIPIPSGFWSALEELLGALDVAADELRDIAQMADWDEEEADFVANTLQLFHGSEHTRHIGKDVLVVDGVEYSCDVLLNAPEVDGGSEFDGLETPDGMSTRYMRLWVSDEDSPHPGQPLKLEIDVGVANATEYSPSPRTITRTASELGVANGWVYQKRTRVEGLQAALGAAVPYVETVICQMIVNQAEPFGPKSAELKSQAMANCSN